jgi:hypothetical protein
VMEAYAVYSLQRDGRKIATLHETAEGRDMELSLLRTMTSDCRAWGWTDKKVSESELVRAGYSIVFRQHGAVT